ncbi:MAG TPA: two-component system response regulator [Anaerolineae bacterium]|nr:two-component system response regulator [Anaerolineae bacterium]
MNHDLKIVVILMAEDDADDRLLVKEAFAESHVANSLHFVGDGIELLDYLHGRGEYSNRDTFPFPDLLLLDLNMPRKDGREALKEIKVDPRLKKLPAVVLTTSKADEDILRSYDLGAAGFITKPVTFESLVEIIKGLGEYWVQIVKLPSKDKKGNT